jgi:membrane protein implicated in regulation of membrane protease activity
MMAASGILLADHWWWLIAAVTLGAAEILAPGFFLIWLAAAAAVTGLLTVILGLHEPVQFGLFAIAAVAGIYAARRWLRSNPIVSSDPLLNDRIARLIGEIVIVTEAIEAGHGRVRVADGMWSARGPDSAVGTKVRIVGAEGTTLIVEPD